MARYPEAIWDPMGATPGGSMTPRAIIDHVAAVLGIARPHAGKEWHFYVRLDGTVYQLVDTERKAAANLDANDFAVSIETEGLGDGIWTPAQIVALVKLHHWLFKTHPTIARRRIEGPYGSGLGYHTMFGAPSPWTPVAKTCPGVNRKPQWEAIVLPMSLAAEDDDDDGMTPAESAKLLADVDLIKRSIMAGNPPFYPEGEVLWRLRQAHAEIVSVRRTVTDEDFVDEAAIAAAVLASLSPEEIAQAVAEAVGPELAQQVVDHLAQRLNPQA